MHCNILSKEQQELFPLLQQFHDSFGLVGGTAVALHLGHRRSIDFNLFSHASFDIQNIDQVISIPDLITLGAMKAFALGKRAKWKDYVDLYFIFHALKYDELIQKTTELFGSEFNEKLFRVQLSYFVDVDYSEEVEFMEGFTVSKEDVQKYLTEISLG